jgi:hypothetical protein
MSVTLVPVSIADLPRNQSVRQKNQKLFKKQLHSGCEDDILLLVAPS